MKRLKLFVKNGLLLAATSFLLQIVGIYFNVYIAGKVGAEGMGLFQLVMSVYRFAITFAISAVGLASTRMVAEELAIGSQVGARRAVVRCTAYSLFFSLTAAILLITFSSYISANWLGDSRTLLSLRVLAFSLPFISMSSTLKGYFTAVRCVGRNASAEILEQFVRITFAIMIFELFAPEGIEAACVAIVAGATVSEFSSCAYLWIRFLLHLRKQKLTLIPPSRALTRKLLSITLPMAMSSYLRSGLNTIQQLLIPKGLKKYGASYSDSLATYGTISGMVIPVIWFPSAFLTSFAGLLVPELAEYRTCGRKEKIEYVATSVIRITLMFSVCVAGTLIAFGPMLGIQIYGSIEAGIYIRILAPIVTVMYLDTAVDSMLKGLNEQLASMRYNIIDSGMCVVLVYTLLPLMGIKGYILVIFISEIVNALLSLNRLITVTRLGVNFKQWVAKPVFAILFAAVGARIVTSGMYGVSGLVMGILLTVGLYVLMLNLTGAVTKGDIYRLKLLKGAN